MSTNPDCSHRGELDTDDGVTFTCVDCGYSERSFTAEEARAYLGIPADD